MRPRHLLVCLCLALASPPALASAATGGCDSTTAAQVIVYTNQYRASLGLPRLQVSSKLQGFARAHAADMAANDTLTHASSSGQSFAARAQASSYRFSTLRENVGVQGAPFPAQLGSVLVSLWQHSPPHDANMRARDVNQIGVAVAPGPAGCYASMDLGRLL